LQNFCPWLAIKRLPAAKQAKQPVIRLSFRNSCNKGHDRLSGAATSLVKDSRPLQRVLEKSIALKKKLQKSVLSQ